MNGVHIRGYLTLAEGADAVVEQEIKRSRFLAHARRVSSEDAARDFIAGLRKAHHEARHVCHGFVLGADRDVRRSSDDGEPAGTAGVPILEAILLRTTPPGLSGLSDVCVAVVRYFGGIKLGAGGLVGAYSSAAALVLDAAPPVCRERLLLARLGVPHADAGRVESALRSAGVQMEAPEYLPDRVELTLAIGDSDQAWARAQDRVAAVTSGRGVLDPAGTRWVDRPVGSIPSP